MASFLVVVLMALMVAYVIMIIRHRRRGIVAERGLSIGADLGALHDQFRVRVEDASVAGLGTVRVLFTSEPSPDADERATPPDLDVEVSLEPHDAGFEQLREWQHDETTLAVVFPPGSHLVRLRALDSLQPLTLRRVDEH